MCALVSGCVWVCGWVYICIGPTVWPAGGHTLSERGHGFLVHLARVAPCARFSQVCLLFSVAYSRVACLCVTQVLLAGLGFKFILAGLGFKFILFTGLGFKFILTGLLASLCVFAYSRTHSLTHAASPDSCRVVLKTMHVCIHVCV